MVGFEPTTFRSQSERTTKLCYIRLAEVVRFELTNGDAITYFQDRRFQPLSHTSIQCVYNIKIKCESQQLNFY
jgi:hypothetical protein